MLVKANVPSSPIVYPDSDGNPMADNTKQLRWIVVLFGNLMAMFRDRLDVFIAADLLWYPIEGDPGTRVAPDVMIVFGRPRGDRGSYKQWEEAGIPPTVVFEILSPGNTVTEMDNKQAFYEERGVEEYYVYDPDRNHLMIYLRRGSVLARVRPVEGFVSPRLGIRFDWSGPEMVVLWPDGKRFLSFEELETAREQAERRATNAEERATRAEARAARIVELGRKARRGQASVDELQELDRLEEE